MKRLSVFVGVIVVATLALAAGDVGAVTSAGPYYANPAWSQQLDCSSSSSCPRFVVLSNWVDADHPTGGAAVLDRETGLVWEQSPSTSEKSWVQALQHCMARSVGNRRGWRLPTVQELASLIDPSVPNPGPILPAGHPFSNVRSGTFDEYWSVTTDPLSRDFAWTLSFRDGVMTLSDRFGLSFVWCVRGGQGVDRW
jgi:hypothetical protein